MAHPAAALAWKRHSRSPPRPTVSNRNVTRGRAARRSGAGAVPETMMTPTTCRASSRGVRPRRGHRACGGKAALVLISSARIFTDRASSQSAVSSVVEHLLDTANRAFLPSVADCGQPLPTQHLCGFAGIWLFGFRCWQLLEIAEKTGGGLQNRVTTFKRTFDWKILPLAPTNARSLPGDTHHPSVDKTALAGLVGWRHWWSANHPRRAERSARGSSSGRPSKTPPRGF